MDFRKDIDNYIALEIETLKKIDTDAINDAMNLLMEAAENHKNIYVFGNGGSSATASHYANDFGKGLSNYAENKFRIHCLNDNVPTVMAIANDFGFEEVFRLQLNGLIEAGDIVVAISGSGNSENVIRAVEYAREHGTKIIGLTGFNGGKLKQLCDISLHAPVDSMQISEDIHLIYNHLMMSVLYSYLSKSTHKK